ncbi:MAG: septum formation protein Maf [Candidatus Omnitrophica bacterium]|nr:septum formation protein Maf [Candidatus Omnitrophota bacterium]
MKKLILASGSAQRRKLLKLLDVKFTVIRSDAPELSKIKTTCEDLVKHNALIKARDVASRLKKGVVIGADTVVYLGGKKLILKPKSLQEAKRNLKLLFRRPQWVLTGVAVIDVETGKELVEYEKTRVYMEPLTDAEIDRYYEKMSPLDKAGGFDIEGRGSAFIHRIEGCYTNVIGLPMARLFEMLKKFDISLI